MAEYESFPPGHFSSDPNLLTPEEQKRKLQNNGAAWLFPILGVLHWFTHNDGRDPRKPRYVYVHPDCMLDYLNPQQRTPPQRQKTPYGLIWVVIP